nr:unnamed protein product [Spirometra erinaceieuropaei]
MDLFAATCDNFCPTINADKTVIMHQPSTNFEYNSPQVTVNGNQLQTADNFVYLGSTLTRNTNINDEVGRQSSKASRAFSRLQECVWNRHDLQMNTKLKMNKTVVLTALLYGAGDLKRLRRPCQEAQLLSFRLPPRNTESEMAGEDPGHGNPGTNRNSQHPRHAETTATAMERSSAEKGRHSSTKTAFLW